MQHDRVVVITGAAGGVGSVLVGRFLANGDTVIATDTRKETLEEWRGRWDADAKLVTAAADISADEDCGRLADVARETAGRVDVLVGHAAFKAGIAASVCRPQQPAASHSRVRYEDAFWPSPKPVLFAA